MDRKKAIRLAAIIGALIGAGAVRFDLRPFLARFPFLAFDKALMSHRSLWIVCLAGWLILSVYWEIAAVKTAAAESIESGTSRGVHVFLVSLAQVLVLIPIRGLGRAWPVSVPLMAIGLAVETAGLGVAFWARLHLGQNWSGRIAVKVEHQLIRSGPYGLMRHPIYTGVLAMYLGSAVVTGEWLAMIGLAIVGVAYWRKIRLEEATLDAAFGPDYEAYRRTTKGLVPGMF
ncbi:MAG: isoprenylcysteine carboxylmethyltransferase family protein [Candidatus Sulfotelmatobacter sp.]